MMSNIYLIFSDSLVKKGQELKAIADLHHELVTVYQQNMDRVGIRALNDAKLMMERTFVDYENGYVYLLKNILVLLSWIQEQ